MHQTTPNNFKNGVIVFRYLKITWSAKGDCYGLDHMVLLLSAPNTQNRIRQL